jgi:aldehyde dehydrogenase (NAD+)
MKAITKHYIDGVFVESHGRKVMESVSPTDQRVLGSVMLGDEQDAKHAIAAAKRAFQTYSRTTKKDRSEILNRLHAVTSPRTKDLTDAMVTEYGGVAPFALLMVQTAVEAFRQADKSLQNLELVRTCDKTTVFLEPVGVSGLITAWNANALFVCLKTASALAAGCTVVVKPSEMSPLQNQVFLDCLHEAGLPKGIFNLVNGLGDTVGAELVRNPDVSKISFTGSAAVGETIMRDGAATMKRVTLELGGKSPNILLDDADFSKAIPMALSIAFLNSGQACAAGTRLLVPNSRLNEAKRAIIVQMAGFTVGDPADARTAVGPMVSKKQFERVQAYIRKGIEEGAQVLVGGEGHPAGLEQGNFVKPTVFVNVSNDMRIAQEEIFGPVLSVIGYDTVEEAVNIANDSKYGLHAFVSGADLQRARRVAGQILAGRVVINGMRDDPRAPWGGFKHSGVGREYGAFGIESFLEPRAVLE